jgi:hypothetical protein
VLVALRGLLVPASPNSLLTFRKLIAILYHPKLNRRKKDGARALMRQTSGADPFS